MTTVRRQGPQRGTLRRESQGLAVVSARLPKRHDRCEDVSMPQAEHDFDDEFNFETDQPRARNPDADRDSPTLRKYHQRLWSKELRSGAMFVGSSRMSVGEAR